jgi:hypothetical protein
MPAFDFRFSRRSQAFSILSRHKSRWLDVANPTDFKLKFERSLPDLRELDGFLPYCLNPETERVIYTYTSDRNAILNAPFLYQTQYETAKHVITVPFERMLVLEAIERMDPIYVFSIARCGSTLLSRLVQSIGHSSASEPDLYTQLGEMSDELRERVGNDACLTLIRGCTAALTRLFGPQIVIKLRSECNTIPRLFVEAVPEARFVFMFRDPTEWANSCHRAFGNTPKELAWSLYFSVKAYDELVESGGNPILIWYEDLIADPRHELERLGIEISSDSAKRLNLTLNIDAQEGTSISRESLKQNADFSTKDLEIMQAEWSTIAPRELIERHTLDRLMSIRLTGTYKSS